MKKAEKAILLIHNLNPVALPPRTAPRAGAGTLCQQGNVGSLDKGCGAKGTL